MANYDVIIIGAGNSGLNTGALLAKRGWKVLILEKLPWVGGRISSSEYNGHFLDNGATMPSEAGNLERNFEELGLTYPKFIRFPGGEVYLNGKWQAMAGTFPMKEAAPFLRSIASMTVDEIESYNDVSIKDWAAEKKNIPGWEFLFKYMGQLVLCGDKPEDLSMGELMYFYWEHFKRGMKVSQIGGSLVGGLKSITDPLKNYIEDHDGKFLLNTTVNDIIIKEGKVIGVEIDAGEKIFPSQIPDTTVLEAPIVICTLPIWDLFSIISEDEFPVWYVDWINRLGKKVSHVWNITMGIEKPLWKTDVFKWVPRLPRVGMFGLFYHNQSYERESNDYQLNLVLQGNYNDLPDLSDMKRSKTRRTVRRILDDLEADAMELIPGLADVVKWRIRLAGVSNLTEAPGMCGKHRPSMIPPKIKNLYIVSDTVKEAMGLGTQATAKASRILVEKICPET